MKTIQNPKVEQLAHIPPRPRNNDDGDEDDDDGIPISPGNRGRDLSINTFTDSSIGSSIGAAEMAKRLISALNRVLVEKIVPPSNTNTVILLPEKTAKLNSGTVVAVGLGARDRDGKLIHVSVKEGDSVLLPECGKTEVKLGDKEYHLFRDDDILGTLHD